MKRFRSAVSPLLTLAILALLAGSASAQKSTIHPRSGGPGSSGPGGSVSSGRGGSIGGGMRPVALPPVGRPSGGSSVRSRGGAERSPGVGTIGRAPGVGTIGRSPTMPSDFPLRGRQPTAVATSPVSAGGRATVAPRGVTTAGKGFLRSAPRTPSRPTSRHSWIDRRRPRTARHFVYDPFFYDPFLRYSRFDRYRYFSGFGCGYYDRWYPGYFGYRSFGHNPCFSSFSLFLGWPGLHDPWPGFWSWGYYRDLADHRENYPDGFADGYARGYSSGEAGARDAAYDAYGYPSQSYAESYAQPYATESGSFGNGYSGAASPAEGGYAGAVAGSQSASFESAYAGPTSAAYEEGRRLMVSGDYEGGLAAFDAYAGEAPGDPLGHLSRGVALTSLGHYREAAESFRRGMDAYQPWQRAYLDAPAFYASRAEFRAIEDGLEAYVRTHADDLDARFVLGVTYLFSGQRDAAGSLLRGLGNDRHARYLMEGLGNGG